MKAELKLELYAIAIGVSGESGSGYMSHDLEICTETDVMYLPIKATVLTSDQYEKYVTTPSSPHPSYYFTSKIANTRSPFYDIIWRILSPTI